MRTHSKQEEMEQIYVLTKKIPFTNALAGLSAMKQRKLDCQLMAINSQTIFQHMLQFFHKKPEELSRIFWF